MARAATTNEVGDDASTRDESITVRYYELDETRPGGPWIVNSGGRWVNDVKGEFFERQVGQPILVVEDDETILTSIVTLLEDEGFAVVTANNGKVAIDWLGDGTPSLVLLDMKMPVMDGWAFAEIYRTRPGHKAPLVVMTAARDAKNWANDVGADDYIAKPFDLDDLLNVVRKYSQSSMS